ncbi:hypothetical protein FRC17_007226 [Serendipita sp. 399]|nr:hypothetical protein FRC17_007226 [Serendipita sp. 399]
MASSGLSLAERLGESVPGGRVGRAKSNNSMRSQPYGASPRSTSTGKFGDKQGGSKRDLDAKWTHDMFASHNGIEGGELGARLQGSVGRQITSGVESASRLVRSAFAGALGKPATAPAATSDPGLSIKGASSNAGTGVEVEGLASGTTAEDVAEIFSQCGAILEHRLLTRADAPSIRVYLNFETPQGAQAAVSRFDKQTADGRTLNVFIVSASSSLASRLGVEQQRKNLPSKTHVDLLAPNSSSTGGMRSDELVLNDPRAKVITDPSGVNQLIHTANASNSGGGGRGRGGEHRRGGGRGRGRGRGGPPNRSLSSRMDVD